MATDCNANPPINKPLLGLKLKQSRKLRLALKDCKLSSQNAMLHVARLNGTGVSIKVEIHVKVCHITMTCTADLKTDMSYSSLQTLYSSCV